MFLLRVADQAWESIDTLHSIKKCKSTDEESWSRRNISSLFSYEYSMILQLNCFLQQLGHIATTGYIENISLFPTPKLFEFFLHA